MSGTIFIFGTSGHAREVGDLAWALGLGTVYVAETDTDLANWKGLEDAILEEDLDRYGSVSCAMGIGSNAVRARVAARHSDRAFPTLVHPDTSLGKGVREMLSATRGVVVCAGVRLAGSVTCGDFAIFNRNSTVGHDSIIGACVHVAPGAVISGNVTLGEQAHVGAGAVVNQGLPGLPLAIGAGVVIGSGAVVTRSLDNGVYAGVPAKRLP